MASIAPYESHVAGQPAPRPGSAASDAICRPVLDPTCPSAARIYDCALGGKNHFSAGRRAVDMIRVVLPEVSQAAWANRRFHQRAAQWMARQGIGQFLDLGCGLPIAETTHEAVQQVNPAALVAYIDHDPMVIAHARALLNYSGATTAILADVRDPAALLAAVHLDGLIDLAYPAGVLCTAVLDHVADEDDPRGCLARLTSALAPGSYVALSHLTADRMPPDGVAAITAAYQDASEQVYPRSRAQVASLLDGLDLVQPYTGAPPQVCRIGLWGAENPAAATDDSPWWWAAVARRTGKPSGSTPGGAASPGGP